MEVLLLKYQQNTSINDKTARRNVRERIINEVWGTVWHFICKAHKGNIWKMKSRW